MVAETDTTHLMLELQISVALIPEVVETWRIQEETKISQLPRSKSNTLFFQIAFASKDGFSSSASIGLQLESVMNMDMVKVVVMVGKC